MSLLFAQTGDYGIPVYQPGFICIDRGPYGFYNRLPVEASGLLYRCQILPIANGVFLVVIRCGNQLLLLFLGKLSNHLAGRPQN